MYVCVCVCVCATMELDSKENEPCEPYQMLGTESVYGWKIMFQRWRDLLETNVTAVRRVITTLGEFQSCAGQKSNFQFPQLPSSSQQINNGHD